MQEIQGRRSAAKSCRTSKPAPDGPSVRDMQAAYSRMLRTPTDGPMLREDIRRGLFCIALVHEARSLESDERKKRFYGTYVDDLLLETIYLRPEEALEENSMVNTFMGDMGPPGQTLAVAFCANI